MTRAETKATYAIICYNMRTYESGGVVEVIKGRQNAEAALKSFETCQNSADRQLGWRYFIVETDLKAGIDPAEATTLRQAALELRESRAIEELNLIPGPRPETSK